MTIKELIIIGIQTSHYFEIGSHQEAYIVNELGFTREEASTFLQNPNAELSVRICNANLLAFQKLLKDTHKGKKYSER